MIAITVDDERPMLNVLTSVVSASPDIFSVTEFTDCSSALEWVKSHPLDVAFLDINMCGMGGLVLAKKIQNVRPGCKIIFCTGSARYAVEAFKIHASGYLMKPITAEAIQKEIDYIKGKQAKEKLLTVKCFGNFEVLSRGEVLNFKRSRSKELLAVLVDRNGAGMSARQICSIMWPDSMDDSNHMNYLRKIFSDLRKSLETSGSEEVLLQNGHNYFLDTERIDCDYYSFLQSGEPEFRGEYMTQYSWAEETCALLWHK